MGFLNAYQEDLRVGVMTGGGDRLGGPRNSQTQPADFCIELRRSLSVGSRLGVMYSCISSDYIAYSTPFVKCAHRSRCDHRRHSFQRGQTNVNSGSEPAPVAGSRFPSPSSSPYVPPFLTLTLSPSAPLTLLLSPPLTLASRTSLTPLP